MGTLIFLSVRLDCRIRFRGLFRKKGLEQVVVDPLQVPYIEEMVGPQNCSVGEIARGWSLNWASVEPVQLDRECVRASRLVSAGDRNGADEYQNAEQGNWARLAHGASSGELDKRSNQ